MTITAYAKDLAQAAAACAKVVLKKTDAGALGGILFKAEGSKVTLTGYDLSTGIETTVAALVAEAGSAVMDIRIADILNKLPTDQVTITVQNNVAQIESGDASYSLVCMKAEDYPELPDFAKAQGVDLPKETLLSMVRQTIFSVSKNENKVVHTGVKFEITAEKIELIAVDGFRLAVRREQSAYAGQDSTIIVPAVALGNVMSLMAKEKDETVKIFADKRHVAFSVERYTVVSRLLDGEFLNYHAAVPKTANTTVEVDVAEMQASIERAAVIIDNNIKRPLRCRIGDGKIQFSVASSLGTATDTITADIKGDALEIGFNSRFLLDALKAAETDRVLMQFVGASGPATITPLQGDSFLFLILPVRLKAE